MPRKTNARSSGHTILVVDDQLETLDSVRLLLERDGHRVLVAESGERALALFKENDVHLLLVDYFMPRMTGEDLVREIRTFDPHVQIILQTGYSGEKPPRTMLAELDIQGYHDKAEGPEALLLWVDVGLKAYRCINRLQQRERLQSELVASVSHEFRTPLGVLRGYCELLRQGDFGALPAEALDAVRAMETAGRNLTALVTDFLQYAKIQARAISVGRQRIDLGEVVGEIEDLARDRLHDRPISFTVNLVQAPAQIVTDSLKLSTILRNLISNALKFTVSGSIVLRVARCSGELEFAVQDTGPGIAPEHLEMIFEPFRQLDGSMTRQHSGLGLGLPLSRKLAALLGGKLLVQSEPGVGSVFTLTLPASVLVPAEVRRPAWPRATDATAIGEAA